MNWKSIKAVEYIVIHCAATKANQDIGVEDIAKWHRERGWFDVGYHYVIRRDGTVETGRPKDRPGAHARGYNHLSLGICLAGGVAKDGRTPEDNFTPEQYASLETLVINLKNEFPRATVLGHRDLPNVNKGCPSFNAIAWWAGIEEEINDTGRKDSAPPKARSVNKRNGGCRPV